MNGFANFAENFEVSQFMEIVSPREARDQLRLVLKGPHIYIVSHTGVTPV